MAPNREGGSLMLRRVLRFLQVESDAIERGDDGLPTAFRIWKFGENPTAEGTDLFDDESAELLEKQQAEYGNDFAFDYNHATWNPLATAHEKRAAGYHRLEIRRRETFGDAAGCWLDVRSWTEEARGYLLPTPPLYRYFSPAFKANSAGAIREYLNCALTNSPATYGIPSLRSQSTTEGNTMTIEQLLAALGIDPAELDGLDAEGVKALVAAKLAPAEPDGDEQRAEDPAQPVTEQRAEDPQAPAPAPAQRARAIVPTPRRTVPTRVAGTVHGGFVPCNDVSMRSMAGLKPKPSADFVENPYLVRGSDGVLYFARNVGDRERISQLEAANDYNRKMFGGAQ